MSVLEIIAAILLILACVFIVLVVLMQDSKQNMSQTISGSSGDNYYQKNSGRTKEAKLARMTKAAAVVLFVVALLVNFITIWGWGKSSGTNSGTTTTPAITTVADESDTGTADTEAAGGTEDSASQTETEPAETTAS